MQLACPKCGTREVRVSHRSGLFEAIKGLVGVYPLRCRRCRHRWLTSAWAGGAWRYARCPRCYRQELTTWSEQYYHPPRLTVMCLRMGATPYRCAACRCNFSSFKPCKEKFSWRHEDKIPAPVDHLEEAATAAVPTPAKPVKGNGAMPRAEAPAPSVKPDPAPPIAVHAPRVEPAPARPQPVEADESEPYL